MEETQVKHYALVKREGYDRAGKRLTARESAITLLKNGIWPLFERTRNFRQIKAGDQIAIYLAGPGNQTVIATAQVKSISPWNREAERTYPLMMDGIPILTLNLMNVAILPSPVHVVEKISKLSFTITNTKKWGVAFMGGARSLTHNDFLLLTTS